MRPTFESQRWHSVLFLHWPVPPRALQPHLPDGLTADTFQGSAWIGAALATVTEVRVCPSSRVLRGLSSFHQVTLRACVRLGGGAPGVWTFGLDATSFVAGALARLSLGLPGHLCHASRSQSGDEHHYEAQRVAGARSQVSATWRAHGEPRPPPPGSLEHFLVQRFSAYSQSAGQRSWRHRPWALVPAEVRQLEHTLDDAHHLPPFPPRPLAHWSPGVDVEFRTLALA